MTNSEAITQLEFILEDYCESTPLDQEAINMAIEALEECENNGWIPVSKGLPKENKIVLVTEEYDIGSHHFIQANVSYFYGKDRKRDLVWSCKGGLNHKVIAWKPLPEVYKIK